MLDALASRLQAIVLTGSLALYPAYQVIFNPVHLVWDLDNTLVCSLALMEEGKPATAAASLPPEAYFDQIDDDFPFDGEEPNTRTFWRPGAKAALQFLSLFTSQHVYTAAQASYTENILRRLDPGSKMFKSVTHRDLVPHHDYHSGAPIGKDLARVPALSTEGQLARAILLDDRVYNFTPQPGNGLHVQPYEDVSRASQEWEMARVCLIAIVATLFPGDLRPLLRHFRSKEHKEKFPEIE
mmetsp:Transcript_7438/g.20999  ORF Transcript_7438/g.20999 Transcript_7438/m.20999 type:complete len:240 (-) Transcript_7438:1727-2446(-)